MDSKTYQDYQLIPDKNYATPEPDFLVAELSLHILVRD